MHHLAAAGNTEIPAYLALKKEGFEIIQQAGDPEMWLAENGEVKFSAESPLQLLGLWALWAKRGEDWRASDREIDDFLKRFYPDRKS